jgi:hypothetical protein
VIRPHPVAGLVLAGVVLAGCELISPVPAGRVDCGDDTPERLCDAVALAAIGAVNQAAIGPIDLVEVRSVPCRESARAEFGVWENATRCWYVDLVGRGSRTHSVVYQEEVGSPLRAYVPHDD